ncbi:Ras protein Rab-35 [Fasciola gigantica]|uniref:Ras protein Rab-35 n=1 Tax=Fasciola gigantica TaxID=46835 RepID=A0A504Y5V3_FASGI|nr:Ras protein Rab-35 [Fasciola gigantica]
MDNLSNDVINFKLLIIGDSGVGKSSLLMRYINDSFDNRLSATIGVDFRIKVTTVPDGSTVKLSIWVRICQGSVFSKLGHMNNCLACLFAKSCLLLLLMLSCKELVL